MTSLAAVLTLATLVASVLALAVSEGEEDGASPDEIRALYAAEAGLSDALYEIATRRSLSEPVPTLVGHAGSPLAIRGGSYSCTVVENGDATYAVVSTGKADLATRTIRAVIARDVADVFAHAIFGGNSTRDPAYELRLSGRSTEADEVHGVAYSGGDVMLQEDATVNGAVLAGGSVIGTTGRSGVVQRPPDMATMDYERNHDVDVAARFDASGSVASSPLGGRAMQLPQADPAHIFRKNPSDRTDETSSTGKDDFFLEDPYTPPLAAAPAFGGAEGHAITLSGVMGNPGPSGTDKVYFVDGNLWVHNKQTLRIRIPNSDPEGTRLTFAVKGNIYLADDVYLEDPVRDGLAFLAIRDPLEADSGNIYFGDPRFGTLRHMDAFLYAENDFYDTNLDASGSAAVSLHGNMTAGNHVSIRRDFTRPDGSVAHSKLTVDFDDRLVTGALDLPGLPRPDPNGVGGLRVVFWREVATP